MIRDQGILIGRLQNDQLLLFLYQIHGFYVEVIFHVRPEGNVYAYKGQRSFEDTDQLEPYLERIKLPMLV